MKVRLIALHGFLQGPDVWDLLRSAMPWAEMDAVDLWPLAGGNLAGAPWVEMDRVLERELRERARREPLLPSIVLGYSFGARLALAVQALEQGRLPVAGACLVSCHPGLGEDDLDGRAQRRAADEAWARKFESETEEEIRRAWDGQPVLASSGSKADAGTGLPAPRASVALAMRRFSLAGQPDFTSRLSRWQTPLLWVTGEDDWKFDDMASWLRSSGARATFASVPAAGHRVPWDNPGGFAGTLRRWLAGVPGID